ncbi:MAG TPA: GMC family oxidoreductase, partial [Herpetosiphonaceae bacterium]|nr:GMC family oxidoreductase [Herpetosiphonaceae bacterium]
AGRRVVVLEAGSGQQAPDYDQHELKGMQNLYLGRGLTASHDLGVAILAGATLGGGTAVNWQTSLRLPPSIRDEWAERSGCRQFVEGEFDEAIAAVTTRLGINTRESHINPNNAVLRDGCTALGYPWTIIPRNADGCDYAQCGYCCYGCRHGGKQSTTVTYLRDAQQTGRTTIVAHCKVERIVRSRGRVMGVVAEAADPATGRRYPVEVRAPVVVVAAGSIQSPALLLRSGIEGPAVGQHLYLHPTSAVAGIYRDPIRAWIGPPQTILSEELAFMSGNYGVRLEAAPLHPGLLALATPWLSARGHRRQMQQMAHTSALIVLERDENGGRVRIGRDGRAVIRYRLGAQERDHIQRGIAAAARVHLAAGTTEVLVPHTSEPGLRRVSELAPARIEEFCQELGRRAVDRNWSTLFSAHQMGTCRMGRDARTAVCDGTGAVFGVRGLFVADASAFPASSGVNPMLTVMALAHMVAQHIKQVPMA